VKWENREKKREGEERRQGGVASQSRLLRVYPARLRDWKIEPCLINGK